MTGGAQFAFSLNEERRHLFSGQRAALAAELMPILSKEAEKRKLATLKQNSSDVEKFPPRDEGKSRDHAAQTTGSNGKYVDQASKIKERRKHPSWASVNIP